MLDLYDPDRLRSHLREGVETTREEFTSYFAGLVKSVGENGGKGVALLTDGIVFPDPQPPLRGTSQGISRTQGIL